MTRIVLRRLESLADPHRPRCFALLKVAGQDGRGWDRMVCAICGRFYGYRPFWLGSGEELRQTVEEAKCRPKALRDGRRGGRGSVKKRG